MGNKKEIEEKKVIIESKYSGIKVYRHGMAGSVVLKLGANPIDGKDYEVLKKNESFTKRVDQGLFIVHKNPVSEAKTPEEAAQASKDQKENIDAGAAEDLSAFNVKQAKNIVEKTLDYEVLKKWSTEESRAAVAKVIADQMDAVNPEKDQ